MADIIVAKPTVQETLTAMKAGGGPLDALLVMLCSDDLVPNRDTTFENLTPVAFSGYAVSTALVWSAPYLDILTGDWKLIATGKVFRSTDPAPDPFVGGTVRLWAAYKAAAVGPPAVPARLVLCQRFDAAIVINSPDQLIEVIPVFPGKAILPA